MQIYCDKKIHLKMSSLKQQGLLQRDHAEFWHLASYPVPRGIHYEILKNMLMSNTRAIEKFIAFICHHNPQE